MAKHRKRRTKYNGRYKGRHRAVVPKSYTGQRMAVVLPLTIALALYPTVAGIDSGFISAVKEAIPILGIFDVEEAEAGEVIPDPIEDIDPPVVDLGSPAS